MARDHRPGREYEGCWPDARRIQLLGLHRRVCEGDAMEEGYPFARRDARSWRKGEIQLFIAWCLLFVSFCLIHPIVRRARLAVSTYCSTVEACYCSWTHHRCSVLVDMYEESVGVVLAAAPPAQNHPSLSIPLVEDSTNTAISPSVDCTIQNLLICERAAAPPVPRRLS